MSKAVEEFNKISCLLLEVEVRYNQLESYIVSTEKEIALLKLVESNLTNNIDFLRNSSATTKMSEYKKANDDLKRCKTRLSIAREHLLNAKAVFKNAEAEYAQTKQLYEEAFDNLSKSDNNVTKVDFTKGKKDEQK